MIINGSLMEINVEDKTQNLMLFRILFHHHLAHTTVAHAHDVDALCRRRQMLTAKTKALFHGAAAVNVVDGGL